MDFVLHRGVVFSLRLSQLKEFSGCTNLLEAYFKISSSFWLVYGGRRRGRGSKSPVSRTLHSRLPSLLSWFPYRLRNIKNCCKIYLCFFRFLPPFITIPGFPPPSLFQELRRRDHALIFSRAFLTLTCLPYYLRAWNRLPPSCLPPHV